jgi:hypothetical protein
VPVTSTARMGREAGSQSAVCEHHRNSFDVLKTLDHLPSPGSTSSSSCWLANTQTGISCGHNVDSVSPTHGTVPTQELPDFVAQSSDMKKILSMALPHTSVSVKVHRVGDSLFLDSEISLDVPPLAPSSVGMHSPPPHSPGRASKTTTTSSWRFTKSQAVPLSANHGGLCGARQYASNNAIEPIDKLCFGSLQDSDVLKDPERSGMCVLRERHMRSRQQAENSSDGAADDAIVPPEVRHGIHHKGCQGATARSQDIMQVPGGTGAVQNVFTWELDNVTALLGSDTVMLQGGHHMTNDGQVNVHYVQKHVTAETCLDLWLENVLSNADALALCYHTDGEVQVWFPHARLLIPQIYALCMTCVQPTC